ncbi:MAG TPA: adenylate/guanylate cyclase domain-containing protein [Patescibacteria group bacterium]|nr:adenylate/guanylate cyclase domain-containing protein [Patescibacteria group bacterium]
MSKPARATDAQPSEPPSAPPTGTVTFLFSDIEGSTRLLEQLGDRYAGALLLHRDAMRRAFAAHGGVERGTEGDSFFVAFPGAAEAVSAAVSATTNLAAIDWPDGASVRVRIGLHTGEGRLVDDDYVGMDVHRAARIAAAGHGGQVLLSQSTRILAERALPEGVSLRDLGEHRLKDLPAPEHLYQLDIDGQRTDFPPLRSLARTVVNLPAALPSILGRDQDVAKVRNLVRRNRLVTVTGPGGTGKTRLVQEVARSIVGEDQLDVVFVPLEGVHDVDQVPIEILRALRLDIAVARDPIDRLAEHVGGRGTLLVLDNLEQLSGAGLVVRPLLDRAPSVSVLASSQAALHVAAEQEYALRPLLVAGDDGVDARPTTDDSVSPAIALFVERARAVRSDFELDAANADAILAICTRLDGLPLAIELAAAQVKLLAPQAILQRIEGSLDSLTSRREDLPARQKTLRATVSWSYELLGEDERRLFRRLAVFSGGARLMELEAIGAAVPPVSDVVDVLGTLVDRSLVNVRHGVAGDDRFSLFETMRTYARELLASHGEDRATSLEHARIYRTLAHEAAPRFYGADRRAWLDRISAEHGNFGVALEVLHDGGELAAALDLGADLWRYWQQRGHLVEGVERMDRLLAAVDAPGAPAVPPFILSRAEEAAGSLRYWLLPDRREAQPLYERSVQHAIESGDRDREAWARYNLAFVFDFVPEGFGQADIPRATKLRERALEIFRAVGDERGVGESLWAMGGSAQLVFNDSAAARRHLTEALPILQGIGDLFAIAWTRVSLALTGAIEGKLADAEFHALAAAEAFVRDGDISGEILSVQQLGALAARRGDDVTAARFKAAALAAMRSLGADLPPIPPILEPLEEAAARMAPEDLEREQEIGRALGVQAILSTALEAWRARGGAATGP